jgi:hypothetical protein
MTEPPPLTPIYVAIPRIIGDLPGIGKDSTMTEGPRYDYRGIDDIMPHVKQLFARHGVHIAPIYELVSDTEVVVGRNNSKMTRVVLKGMFRFTANDGSSIVCQTYGEARDSGDKAFNKAMTAALKYAIIQVLAIADGDDPDDYRPELAEGEQRGGQAAPAAVSYPNYDALKALGPALAAAGLAPAVKLYAADMGIDLRPGHGEDRLPVVLAEAERLLAAVNGNAGPPSVPEPIKPDTDVVAQARKELDEAIERAGLESEAGVAIEDVDTTDPLARIMDQFGPGTEVVEEGQREAAHEDGAS